MNFRPLACTIILLWSIATLCFAQKDTVTPIAVGSPAPAFNLEGIDGKSYSLESFKDYKVIVIIFTANHCPTAQAYEDRIIKLVEDYKSKGVALSHLPVIVAFGKGFTLITASPEAVCKHEVLLASRTLTSE